MEALSTCPDLLSLDGVPSFHGTLSQANRNANHNNAIISADQGLSSPPPPPRSAIFIGQHLRHSGIDVNIHQDHQPPSRASYAPYSSLTPLTRSTCLQTIAMNDENGEEVVGHNGARQESKTGAEVNALQGDVFAKHTTCAN